jgi:hypothetical protein
VAARVGVEHHVRARLGDRDLHIRRQRDVDPHGLGEPGQHLTPDRHVRRERGHRQAHHRRLRDRRLCDHGQDRDSSSSGSMRNSTLLIGIGGSANGQT